MKRLKMLAAAALAVAGVLAVAGLLGSAGASSTAAETFLCTEGAAAPCPTRRAIETGASIEAVLVSGTKSRLTTFYGNVECGKSTIDAEIASAGGGIGATVESLTFEECNCEVKVLSAGTLELQRSGNTGNTLVESTGTEVTTLCPTVAGNVHCMYATDADDLGKLEGGNPAVIKINGASIPRLATNPRCEAGAKWEAEYKVSSPRPLYVGSE